jgi:uncharacterized SAM-binding protein YcdF (DUF218 family)
MDIILELGGNVSRMQKVCELAEQYPNAKIIVSSESPCSVAVDMLRQHGIGNDRFLLDYAAWDTVTNFTETYGLIKSYRPQKIYVVTDKFHMPRSMAIAASVYLFDKISLIACPFFGGDLTYKEPLKLIVEDALRSLVWRFTKHLIYDTKVKDARWAGIRAEKQLAIGNGYPVTAS